MLNGKEALYPVLYGIGLFFSMDVLAQSDSASDAVEDESVMSWWQTGHHKASTQIAAWSQGIDEYLSGQEQNLPGDSYVRLRMGPIINDRDEYSGFFDFSARLKLPNTQDRLRLVIESDGDTISQDNVRGESTENIGVLDSALDSNVSAVVRYIKEEWRADFDAGIKIDFPLNPFVRFRLFQGEHYGDWEWRQKQEAFAYYDEGIGARYEAGVTYFTTPQVLLGANFGTTWLESKSTLYVREDLYLHHQLDERNRLDYQLSFLQEGKSKVSSDSVLYFLEYHHKLYKNWLIGRVKPQMTYEADEDYRAVLSLTLSMEILLGQKYLH
ncbi:hypothetical protein ACUM5Y_07835 [Marinomonas dokdonensis]|uniref:hypothetical protein n=1 Tax=Marinomonas dokdonensis TaxID=328224 RepID=UPI00405561E5